MLLLGTMVGTGLAQIWKPQRTDASSPRTIARTASFRHHEKRILGIPTENVNVGCPR